MHVFIAAVGFVAGMIIKWSGSYANIPTGFILCDGAGGSPNLTDHFVVGAGVGYASGDSGGSTTHTHTASQAAHTHDLATGDIVAAGTDMNDVTTSKTPAITVQPGANLPPYYALYYIMKT